MCVLTVLFLKLIKETGLQRNGRERDQSCVERQKKLGYTEYLNTGSLCKGYK